jgi:hypothetical protein
MRRKLPVDKSSSNELVESCTPGSDKDTMKELQNKKLIELMLHLLLVSFACSDEQGALNKEKSAEGEETESGGGNSELAGQMRV